MWHQANVATLGENLQELWFAFYPVNVSTFDLTGKRVCSLRLLEALVHWLHLRRRNEWAAPMQAHLFHLRKVIRTPVTRMRMHCASLDLFCSWRLNQVTVVLSCVLPFFPKRAQCLKIHQNDRLWHRCSQIRQRFEKGACGWKQHVTCTHGSRS